MHYIDFQGEKLSAYGMGTMRLPVVDGADSAIDETAALQLFDYAYEQGVNYFDTAWGYHGGNSELVTGKALARYERSTFNVATKFPGYDVSNFGKHQEIFERQLEKLQVGYVDFYLLHNICETNIEHYLAEETYGTEAYFVEQKRAGRIRHLGFSSHATFDNFKRFLDRFGDDMEFCQLEVNYFDWDFQDAKRKVEYCQELGIPIWVMEPLRGGYLCTLDQEYADKLAAFDADASPTRWALRWLIAKLPDSVILNGAGSMETMRENIATFNEQRPLSATEMAAIDEISRSMAKSIGLPCTACHYCVDHCPMELDIPFLISLYNEQHTKEAKDNFIAPMAISSLPEDKRPSACIGCGSCTDVCPQALEVADALAELAEAVE